MAIIKKLNDELLTSLWDYKMISIVLALLAVVHWHAAHAVLVKDGVYSFTTCNKEGPTGPSLADCKNHNGR